MNLYYRVPTEKADAHPLINLAQALPCLGEGGLQRELQDGRGGSQTLITIKKLPEQSLVSSIQAVDSKFSQFNLIL